VAAQAWAIQPPQEDPRQVYRCGAGQATVTERRGSCPCQPPRPTCPASGVPGGTAPVSPALLTAASARAVSAATASDRSPLQRSALAPELAPAAAKLACDSRETPHLVLWVLGVLFVWVFFTHGNKENLPTKTTPKSSDPVQEHPLCIVKVKLILNSHMQILSLRY